VGGAEIVVRSAEPRWLALPWELMRDPDDSGPLALAGISLARSLPGMPVEEAFAVGGERLRVLMVISLPLGASDVGYQMIARPMLGQLAAVRSQVDIVVLRPPTLDALELTLRKARDAGAPFQVVHFDGHGVLTGARAGLPGQGMLVFEAADGGSAEVPAERIAQVLAEAQVPVIVLNACQSGAIGKELEATVATRLLAGGAAAVVAMSYSVYAVAAAEFMTAFYDRLFAGDTVGEAVRAGRARMAHRPDRPSPKGSLPLADWLIPVHYRRQDIHFPGLREHRRDGEQARAVPASIPPVSADELAPAGDFVGRDALVYGLERAARTNRVIILHGPAGTGKTEAAKAFGRWCLDTAGVDDPDLVFVHSFRPGVASFGVDGVISAIGARVFGSGFDRQDPRSRRDRVHELLAARRLLLIWDNFESAVTIPDPDVATPPLDDEGRRELSDFIARVAAEARSTIVITSRTTEPWLVGTGIARIEVGGLTRQDAIAYADALLSRIPAAAEHRADRSFEELMEWLDGHPLSMRATLPLLDSADARVLLDGLRGSSPLHGNDHTSLAASLTYSLAHLGSVVCDVLTAVALFDGVVYAAVLTRLSGHEHVPPRFRIPDLDLWMDVLEEASRVGLLTALGKGMFAIHPALPAYLTEQWRASADDHYASERAAAEQALLDTYVSYAGWMYHEIEEGRDATAGFEAIHRQRRNWGRLLAYAVDSGQWKSAGDILWPLHEYWINQGLLAEVRHWGDRILHVLRRADGTPPPLDQPAGELWVLVTGMRAARVTEDGDLADTISTLFDLLEMVQAQPDSAKNRARLARICLHLASVVEEAGESDEAEQWYRRCLWFFETLGDRTGIAGVYNRLAGLAATRGRLGESENWTRQALAIYEPIGHRRGTASAFNQLGDLARDQDRLEEAEHSYMRALMIHRDVDDRSGMAASYFNFGIVAERRHDPGDAERWFQQALALYDEIGSRTGIAGVYFHLGKITREQGRLDEAEQWFLQALSINRETGDRVSMAAVYGQLGALSEHRGDQVDALRWIVLCVRLFDEFPHPATDYGPDYLALLTDKLGIEVLREQWAQVTGDPLPAEIEDFCRERRKEFR
jgi:tetratricopeptide (TPR) repeat protein